MKKKLLVFATFGLIIIFLIESQFDLVQINYFGYKFRGELSLLEMVQNLVLVFNLFFILKFRKLLVKSYNKISYLLRVSFVSIILYEEISFITYGISDFFKVFNYQNEINIHNSYFMGNRINFHNIDLIFSNISFSITIHFLLYTLVLFFIGYGSYLTYLTKFRLFFLERKNSIYCLLYFFIELINSILRDINLTNGNPLLNHEFLELIIYMILLKDTFDKINYAKKKV